MLSIRIRRCWLQVTCQQIIDQVLLFHQGGMLCRVPENIKLTRKFLYSIESNTGFEEIRLGAAEKLEGLQTSFQHDADPGSALSRGFSRYCMEALYTLRIALPDRLTETVGALWHKICGKTFEPKNPEPEILLAKSR